MYVVYFPTLYTALLGGLQMLIGPVANSKVVRPGPCTTQLNSTSKFHKHKQYTCIQL